MSRVSALGLPCFSSGRLDPWSSGSNHAPVDSLTTPVSENAHDKLSDRELQTLVLIASGKRLADIAELLTLSPKTVSVYRARVLDKLGLQNNSELTVYAIRQGLVGN